MTDIRVCQRDGSPLAFTFEYPGAEYVCMTCRGTEGVLGRRAPATPALRREQSAVVERYERDYAERRGVPYTPSPQATVENPGPTCGGCGATPELGTPLPEGKPTSWFSRTIDGVTEYACSRACITGGLVAPW